MYCKIIGPDLSYRFQQHGYFILAELSLATAVLLLNIECRVTFGHCAFSWLLGSLWIMNYEQVSGDSRSVGR